MDYLTNSQTTYTYVGDTQRYALQGYPITEDANTEDSENE